MTWAQARSRIANRLAAVAITSPVSMAIATVHELPTENVTENPVFYMIPPALTLRRGPALREKVYTARVQFLVRDDSMAQATAIAEAFREATVDVFDQDITLEGTATVIDGPDFGEVEEKQLTANGPTFVGFDATFVVRLIEAGSFAA